MKLLTDLIKAQLKTARAADPCGERKPQEQQIVVKFFTPDAQCTWYIIDGEEFPSGDWHLFGFCDLGDRQCAELGYVMLSELQQLRGKMGLPVERDLHYGLSGDGTHTMADVFDDYGRTYDKE